MTNHCRASELRETDDTTKRIVVFFFVFWVVRGKSYLRKNYRNGKQNNLCSIEYITYKYTDFTRLFDGRLAGRYRSDDQTL